MARIAGRVARGRLVAAALASMALAPPPAISDRKVPLGPGTAMPTRPSPPAQGRNRCIGMDNIAAAQVFGDRAIELTMRNGRRYRMFFARECQALSFYQGFYYRRARAGQICAGRDAIGARSGGECPIASILEVRRLPR